jgi:hypothetical protein
VPEDAEFFVSGRGFVGLLDVLGVRGLWLRQPPERTVESYERWFRLAGARSTDSGLSVHDEYYEVELPTFLDFPRPGLRTDILSFSDTVVVVFDTHGRTDGNVGIRLGNTLAQLFRSALDHGFLFRGAVAFGDFYRGPNSRFLLGPAVDEAADWYTQADWAGIHLTPSTTRRPNPLNPRDEPSIAEAPLLVTYPVPLKDGGSVNASALDWTAFGRDRLPSLIEDYFLRPPVSVDVERKRQNTTAFRAAMESRRLQEGEGEDAEPI